MNLSWIFAVWFCSDLKPSKPFENYFCVFADSHESAIFKSKILGFFENKKGTYYASIIPNHEKTLESWNTISEFLYQYEKYWSEYRYLKNGESNLLKGSHLVSRFEMGERSEQLLEEVLAL